MPTKPDTILAFPYDSKEFLMALEIAKRLQKSTPIDSEKDTTDKALLSIPTNRQIRQVAAANDPAYESNGLPRHFYDGGEHNEFYGDREWILAKLRRVNNHQHRQELAKQYGIIFKTAYDAEPVEYRKDGKARFIANKWLLKVTR